eukprot:TRINITY_DN10240_c0_g1_i3.p1 TRINITY_DN10240_c0_g1~~TRINITY_DN10240_c0_g1_i3.p1  ORF type:complete len:1337 (+),score=396.60 TRINITY_DN10240_c0_g1_i3:228-4238(+)
MLTKLIRNEGALLGKLEFDGQPIPIEDPMTRNLIAEVSIKEPVVYGEGNPFKILAVDCGVKANIIRCLIARGAEVTLVPWDHPLDMTDYDGLFIANGPGNPEMASKTVDHLRPILEDPDVKPVFGICMGNQLVATAAGAETYKLPFGNRGQNIPVTNVFNKECFVTPQNHGYAVRTETLPEGYVELFINENDKTNEGIMHTHKPIFTAQFHPEAQGGPTDSETLFDRYMAMVKERKEGQVFNGFDFGKPPVRLDQDVKKVLILGSGGLSIGQAGEFDYSGSQAIKALKEEGIEVVLMNPNIASVQTNVAPGSPNQADAMYSLPVTTEFVEAVIKKEKPDGILISMGGQTALNTGVEMFEAGLFDKYNLTVLGTQIPAVMDTEDRERFSNKLNEIDEKIAQSKAVNNIPDAQVAAAEIGFPVMIRSAYALGGLGSGMCDTPEMLEEMGAKALAVSPQILVEKSMLGWKEVEYEVVRDAYDNCVTVCNMENFDPLGIHTGDSIVVAPSQTLSNDEYHMLRTTAQKVVRHLGIIGECNIQYALDPHSKEYCIIEVNPRLSRSSALASKATGYPLAFIAAKLALGKPLPELRNNVTKSTTACFEPSLDYVVTKIPRWDLKKFGQVNSQIGSAMKSVGEVMAIGRTFEESIQKALRMIEPSSCSGFAPSPAALDMTVSEVHTELAKPTDQRIFALARLLWNSEMSLQEIHDRTKIDLWYLSKLDRIVRAGKDVAAAQQLLSLETDVLKHATVVGFSDFQLASMFENLSEQEFRSFRKAAGVVPVVKQIDTLAAEFPAQTNYLYTTYLGEEDDVEFDVGLDAGQEGVVVLGCGAYRIGSSVEFDWCAVSCIRTLRELNRKSIMINYNPETVSTDYDECDRLYFEEISLEKVQDIYEKENANGVIVSVGGQVPQNLALPLKGVGVKVLGTDPDMIDSAEDRQKFSAMLDDLAIDQPAWEELTSMESAFSFADRVTYPVLVRPSYVLSGAAMKVANDKEELEDFLDNAAAVSKDHPVVISKFLEGFAEIEIDGVARDGEIIAHACSEHVEDAGVHSGDATLVLPPHRLSPLQIRAVRNTAQKITDKLEITGPFNIQFLSKDMELKVIECNLRASRSVPFVSKTIGNDLIRAATIAMLGEDQLQDSTLPTLHSPVRPTEYVGIKVPMFSFTRLRGADPRLSVEMASTGEVACFGADVHEAYLKGLMATRFKLPRPGSNILLSLQDENFASMIHSIYDLHQAGFKLYATTDTYRELQSHDIPCTLVEWPKDITDTSLIQNGMYSIRRAAVDFDVPLLNDPVNSKLFMEALQVHLKRPLVALEPKTLFDHYQEETNKDAWTDPREYH